MTKILTQRGVEAARPKAKRYGRPDGLVPGHRLIVYPSGEKSYALFARVNGGWSTTGSARPRCCR